MVNLYLLKTRRAAFRTTSSEAKRILSSRSGALSGRGLEGLLKSCTQELFPKHAPGAIEKQSSKEKRSPSVQSRYGRCELVKGCDHAGKARSGQGCRRSSWAVAFHPAGCIAGVRALQPGCNRGFLSHGARQGQAFRALKSLPALGQNSGGNGRPAFRKNSIKGLERPGRSKTNHGETHATESSDPTPGPWPG